MFPAMDKVKEQYNIKPDVRTGESLGNAEVVLVQSHFALDFPRPLTPGSLLSTKPSNIKTVDWIPQNDILGHAKTRLFLSHVGHNSMYEAAYHGAPVVGFPLWSDQPENARQITRAGMGLWVDINTVTEDELHTSISRVLSEPSFKQNAKHVSRLIKDQRRTPLELTGDWIEFVLRHNGASHLRVQSFNMPWYQEYSIDVALFVLFIVTCTLTFLNFAVVVYASFVVKVMA